MSAKHRIKALECRVKEIYQAEQTHPPDDDDLMLFLAFDSTSLRFDGTGRVVAGDENYQDLADWLNETLAEMGGIYLPIRPQTIERALRHIGCSLVAVDPTTGFFHSRRQGIGMDAGIVLDCGEVNGATIALHAQTGLERPRTVEGVREFLTWLAGFGQTAPGYLLAREL